MDDGDIGNGESNGSEGMGVRGEEEDLLQERASCKTAELDAGNSQSGVHQKDECGQGGFEVGLNRNRDEEFNLDQEGGESCFFGGFQDEPAIAHGSSHKSYSKRKLEPSFSFNKRQRHTEFLPYKLVADEIFNARAMSDEQSRIRDGCKNEYNEAFYGADSTREYGASIYSHEVSENLILSHVYDGFRESSFARTGENMTRLRLKDFSEKLEPLLSFPMLDSENCILGEPLRDISYNNNDIYGAIAPNMVSHYNERDLPTNNNRNEKENIIDPKVIFKFEANSDHQMGTKKILNEYASIISPKRDSNVLACLRTYNNSKTRHMAKPDDINARSLPSFETSDRDIILSLQKKTRLFTFPTPDQVPDREFNIGNSNQNLNDHVRKNPRFRTDVLGLSQKGTNISDDTGQATKTKPKLSQKLLYIHNLSRSSNTKIDETVAYLHYKLRSYENMAVLTRIRDILQNHQLNLIGIYSQLGIPELLVPRRTN